MVLGAQGLAPLSLGAGPPQEDPAEGQEGASGTPTGGLPNAPSSSLAPTPQGQGPGRQRRISAALDELDGEEGGEYAEETGHRTWGRILTRVFGTEVGRGGWLPLLRCDAHSVCVLW